VTDRGGGGSSSFRPVIVSPPGGGDSSEQASEDRDGISRSLFNEEVNINDIPSLHICPLMREPPVVGVHFDVPDQNRGITEQVFERSQLYRWIATPGNLFSR
jgi:hypothetical protein